MLHLLYHCASKVLLLSLLLKPFKPLIVLEPIEISIAALPILACLLGILILSLLHLIKSILILRKTILVGEEFSLVPVHHISELGGRFEIAIIDRGPLIIASRLLHLRVISLVVLNTSFFALNRVFDPKRG